MIEIKKVEQKPITVIRAATGYELSEYEKNKLATIEEKAQENKIEVIKVNGQQQQVDLTTKEVNINLGGLANKDAITPEDLSSDDTFLIKCEISEPN